MLKETIEEYTSRAPTRTGGNFESCILFRPFFGLAVATQSQAEDYYIYQAPTVS